MSEWQAATVREISTQTPRIKSFFFELPDPISFVAGQHMDVRLTAPDGYVAERSYSIASSPEMPRIELAIELLDDGEVSPFFYETVVVGDSIEMRGPLGGHFIWHEADGGPLLLIGGGSGVVPLVSILRYRKAAGSRVAAVLLLSARTWDDIPFREELLALHDRQDGFQLVLAVTRDGARRPGDYQRRMHAERTRSSTLRWMPRSGPGLYGPPTSAPNGTAASLALHRRCSVDLVD